MSAFRRATPLPATATGRVGGGTRVSERDTLPGGSVEMSS